jgi:hypothetical protein
MIYPLPARHSAGKLKNDVNIRAAKALIGRLYFIDLGFGTSELQSAGRQGLPCSPNTKETETIRRLLSIDLVADER